MLAKEESAQELSFVGSISMAMGVKAAAARLRQSLGVGEHKKFSDPQKYFAWLRDKAHQLGIYVLLAGDMGNWQSQISPEEFRGIAIADNYAPLVVINKYDVRAAMLFTFIHELAHILLGFSAISNNDVFGAPDAQTHEEFCNAVAAEFLVPETALQEQWAIRGDDMKTDISRLARRFSVSDAVICRRLLDLGLITADCYKRLFALYQKRWEKFREKAKSSADGPDNITLRIYDLGEKLLATFTQAVENGRFTLLEAARALNMSVNSFEKAAG